MFSVSYLATFIHTRNHCFDIELAIFESLNASDWLSRQPRSGWTEASPPGAGSGEVGTPHGFLRRLGAAAAKLRLLFTPGCRVTQLKFSAARRWLEVVGALAAYHKERLFVLQELG